MNSAAWKVLGIALLLVCIGAAYVAYDQYQEVARPAEAINRSIIGEVVQVRPGMPDEAKAGIAVAVAAGLGGLVCLYMGFRSRR